MNNIAQYDNTQVVATPRQATVEVETQRAIAEVQASVMLAKRFPRDEDAAFEKLKRECNRTSLAEEATYQYSKGGTNIEGASIRLAEAMVLHWGNIHSGWKETSRTMINGVAYAELEAWAWDMETNNRQTVSFKAKLVRDTKKGSFALKDEREIYEACANQAKRRQRAVILAVIPGWVQDAAVELCKETLKKGVTPETRKILIAAFKDKFGVTEKQIEKFCQKSIEAIEVGQIVRLRQIFQSLKDGMSAPETWFEVEQPQGGVEKPKSKTEEIKEKLKADGESQEPKQSTLMPKIELPNQGNDIKLPLN